MKLLPWGGEMPTSEAAGHTMTGLHEEGETHG